MSRAALVPHPRRVLGADRLLLALITAHVALKVALYPLMAPVGLTGDEIAYADGGRTLAIVFRDLLHLTSRDLSQVDANIVGNGWFMPGSSVLLTPLFLVDPSAAAETVRVYAGLFTTLLLIAVALLVRRELGRPYAIALLVFPGLVPMWVLFSYTVWGDLIAGLVVAALVAVIVGLARRARDGRAPGILDGARLGLLLITCLYFRSSALPLVAGLFVVLALGAFFLLRARARRRGLTAVAVAVGVFAGLLLPWSWAASEALDHRVLSTTTVPIALGVTFGDQDDLCFGPCQGGNIWFASVRYSRELAAISGASELEVQQQMSDYALRDLTAQHYSAAVLANTRRYLLQPTQYEDRFDEATPPTAARIIVVTSWALFGVFLAAFAGAMLLVTRRDFTTQVTSLVLKLAGGALLLQPFVHISHGRYWPTLAPLFAVSAALLFGWARAGSVDEVVAPAEGAAPDDNAIRGALTWLQAVLAGGLLLVAAVLIALATR